MGKQVYLKQEDNYKKKFGIAYRSSTIFYFKKDKHFSTTINYMNYWPIKMSIEVMVIATLRDMGGKLVSRERVNFGNGMVVNYSPKINSEVFEGSLEMEAFAANDLKIPFIAMIVIYESEESVSMVHGYTRTYSHHEIEEGKTISAGEEAGVVVRDNNEIRSFIICHNGHTNQGSMKAVMWITNSNNETIKIDFMLPKLNPYQTLKIYPKEHFKNLVNFLDGKPGNCAVSFELSGSFTRTVVGNETIDGKEMQVYHSNFNYGRHDPGYVDTKEGFFSYPVSPLHDRQFVHLDPFCAKGKYLIKSRNHTYEFENAKRLDIPMSSEVLKVECLNGKLPARINLVFSGYLKNSTCKLPMESARGFYHNKRPTKHRMWMIAALGKKYRSKIFVHSLTDLYGPVGDSIIKISLYRENTSDVVTKEFNAEQLTNFEKGVYVDEIFPDQSNINDNEVGQLWAQASNYGGHQSFTTIEAKNGSASIEHNY